jgi:RNA polymerase sigma factor (sigma-70 family)
MPRYTEEEVEALMAALDELSLDECELIELAYWERLSCRETGIVLGCSEKAAGIRLSRARKHLRDLLNQNPSAATVSLLQREELN